MPCDASGSTWQSWSSSLGCSGPEVHFDYDARANYKDFHTYDWYAASKQQAALAGGVQNALMDARVRRSVEAELTVRNLRKETTADPDILVTYYPVYQPREGSRAHVGIGMGLGVRGLGLGVGVGAPVGRPTGKIGTIVPGNTGLQVTHTPLEGPGRQCAG